MAGQLGAEPVDLLVAHAGELLTCRTAPGGARGAGLRELEVIPDGAVAIQGAPIRAVGPTADLEARYRPAAVLDAAGRLVTPGLVDPHTHLVHAGSRHAEWEARVEGRPAPGGGIWWTVQRTRAATSQALRDQALADLDTMLVHGTTTVEAKSGYGLDADTELRLLGVMAALDHPVEVVATFLGAHVVPPDYADRREEYVRLVLGLLPAARDRASYCDVWCDPVAFTASETRRIASRARELGLGIRLHADQTGDAGGAALAAELGAASADHLDAASAAGIAALAASRTVGVLLPGVTHHLLEATPRIVDGAPAPPVWSDRPSWARRLVDSGACLALSTDYNPGSCPALSMQTIMQLAARLYRLTYAEIWHMSTINAAAALDRSDRAGSLEPGKQADLVVWRVPKHGMVVNRFGTNLVDTVVKRGRMAVQGGALVRRP